MQKGEKYQYGENGEGEVVIPFFEGMIYPFRKISERLNVFLRLTSYVGGFCVLISFLLGRALFCGLGIEGAGFYCSLNEWSVIVSFLVFLFGAAFYINRWYIAGEQEKKLYFNLNVKDIQVVAFILFYCALWGTAGWAFSALYFRIPVSDWREELLFFLCVSLFILLILVLLFNSLLFIRFLEGKKPLGFRQSFWPVFDNIHKILGWFIFYFLFFVYLLREVFVFFMNCDWLPMWLIAICGEFCFYFIVYMGIAVFVSSLAYQERYVFGKD